MCVDLLISQLSMISLICEFPCLFKPPPANLEWSASFFILSSPTVYREPICEPKEGKKRNNHSNVKMKDNIVWWKKIEIWILDSRIYSPLFNKLIDCWGDNNEEWTLYAGRSKYDKCNSCFIMYRVLYLDNFLSFSQQLFVALAKRKVIQRILDSILLFWCSLFYWRSVKRPLM